ncbi:MAG: hypothetical protein QOH25_1606 [Acidobacteriota bacterium]|jgi:hypothetical protein|nr:hypothetical protein [Acidobacteriota bacterium]
MDREDGETLWCPRTLDVFLNRWFASYEDALESLESEGGYLLPYKHQFFVCQAEAIRAMGLEPDDPDWERINWDGARPVDAEAYKRLHEKRAQAVRDGLD